MYQAQIKAGISKEILEFKFEVKVFDDCEQVKENSIFSKCISKNTPESFASNGPILSTSALFPV